MPKYPVTISGRSFTTEMKKTMKHNGLSWDGIEYHGLVSKGRLKRLQAYADEQHLTFRIDNELGRRRTDYRKRFFASHSPDIGSFYICAYCGRWMSREKTTVDHLYPVGQVARDLNLQKKLIQKGIQNINDPKNLVASCSACNDRKKDSMGIWILRGRIGRQKWIWLIRYMIRLAALAFAVWGVVILVNGMV